MTQVTGFENNQSCRVEIKLAINLLFAIFLTFFLLRISVCELCYSPTKSGTPELMTNRVAGRCDSERGAFKVSEAEVTHLSSSPQWRRRAGSLLFSVFCPCGLSVSWIACPSLWGIFRSNVSDVRCVIALQVLSKNVQKPTKLYK